MKQEASSGAWRSAAMADVRFGTILRPSRHVFESHSVCDLLPPGDARISAFSISLTISFFMGSSLMRAHRKVWGSEPKHHAFQWRSDVSLRCGPPGFGLERWR